MSDRKTNKEINEYGIKELIFLLWQSKIFIIAMTLVFAVASVVYSIGLPNKYLSEGVFSYGKSTDGDMSSSLSQLGGLASLAGISLGKNGGANEQQVDMALLKSRHFISFFIEKNDILIPLFAGEEWDPNTNKLLLNPEIYDAEKQEWVRPMKFPFESKPSAQEAFLAFQQLLVVAEDKKTGLITVSLEFLSPALSYQWLNLFISQFNEFVRSRELKESASKIAYLEQQAKEASNANMQTVFFSLMEQEQRKMMLANVSQEYVLKMVDPAIESQVKSSPKRALICVGGTIFGMFISIIFVLIRQFLKSE
ncbi:GNVR domain-containing protein [Thalassomonas haliotis]|uniref:LPS O-antigen length regulator n=1 Tax=Thalassomonas haliotis TaxID=485448 RepID=A0ABY7VJE1_9GAMM|nr:GNVR domain-containing protein [Thalassomonas haliotis]WDE13284.1 LPS O-antigen length regulator [Thalassomonas haliotis]